MKNTLYAEASLMDLFHGLTDDLKLFIREESELTKREMSEKVSCYTRSVTSLVVGGFVAYAGLIVFLGGVGLLIGFAFQHLGLDPLLAAFIGLGIIGLIVILAGAVLILKGKKALATSSLTPEKSIATIKQAYGAEGGEHPQKKEAPKRSMEELQRQALGTRERISEVLDEIAHRASPARIKDRTVEHVRKHPVGWGMAAFVTGFVSSLLLVRKARKPWVIELPPLRKYRQNKSLMASSAAW